jgi:hypothetical protein
MTLRGARGRRRKGGLLITIGFMGAARWTAVLLLKLTANGP